MLFNVLFQKYPFAKKNNRCVWNIVQYFVEKIPKKFVIPPIFLIERSFSGESCVHHLRKNFYN